MHVAFESLLHPAALSTTLHPDSLVNAKGSLDNSLLLLLPALWPCTYHHVKHQQMQALPGLNKCRTGTMKGFSTHYA
jgi:hypothetical protein